MPRVGRNDPCPCGSGKRFKECHGKLALVIEPHGAVTTSTLPLNASVISNEAACGRRAACGFVRSGKV